METIIDLFEKSVEKFRENLFLSEKGEEGELSYGETYDYVEKIAAGLLSYGLKKGDRVALLSEGRNDWIAGELGILHAGGVSVPLSMKLTREEIVFRVNHSDCRFFIVSGYFYSVIEDILPEMPPLEKIMVFSGRQVIPFSDKMVDFDAVVKAGSLWIEQNKDVYVQGCKNISGDDLACISYTSGTTAEPKGIMLTHRNFVCNVLQADTLISIPTYYKILLFLPLDHSFAHTVGIYSFMYNGASISFVNFGRSPMEYLRNIPVNMQEVKPHILLSVPAIAKNFRNNIENGIRQKGKVVELLYRWGLRVGYSYYGLGKNVSSPWYSSLLYPLVKLFDGLVFSKVRVSFGGNLKFFIGGGALLDVELQRYFRTVGIPMYQGYGLSETSPVISSNTPENHIFGSSGKLVSPIDLKICDENGGELPDGQKGEIVVRGGNVMKGYWKNELATAGVIREGWFYTGDLGYMKNGFLYVLGRFKSLLIADDGEKYSPEGIEEAIVEKSKYIDYCMLYNNQSPYTSALIVVNKQALQEYAAHKHLERGSIESYKEMLLKVYEEIMEYRRGGKYEKEFPERWIPAVLTILPETFSEVNGTLNSTTKIVRHKITDLYAKEIEFMYNPEGKNVTNPRNTENIRKFMESKNNPA